MTGAPLPAAGEQSQERPSSSKTTKLEPVVTKRHDRRLVEYFVVVSSVPHDGVTIRNSLNGKLSPPSSPVRNVRKDFQGDLDFEPLLTARYPIANHRGNPLHENVVCFCLPWGIQLRKDPCMPKVHYFVTTGGTGNQMYGVCLTTYEPFKIDTKSDDDFTIYIPKCLCILSIYPYLVAFREYLTQLERLSRSGEMQLPVERYITNFCSEVPAPPPGSFEVQTTISDSVIKIWSPPHNLPIAWVSLPFRHLFECLDIENIITTWHILALERQVLFTSTQLTLLTTCCEIMVSLLFPMRWSHAYIPLVPKVLMPILSAPMPFLCGVHKSDLGDALQHLSSECIVVDLDTNQVSLGPTTGHLPAIPFALEKDLLLRLKANVGMVYREARSLRKNDDFSDRGQHLHSHIKVMADAMWESKLCLFDEAFHLAFTPEMSRTDYLNGNDNSGLDSSDDPFNSTVPFRVMTAKEKRNLRKQSRWDAVQETFMGLYVSLLSTYRQCLVFPSKDGDSSSSGVSTGSYGGAGFRSSDFVRRQRRDRHDFLKDLLCTQMFDDFITKRLYGSGAADVVFFDQAIDKYLRNTTSTSSTSSANAGPNDEDRPRSAPTISKVRLLLGRSTHGAYNPTSPLLQSSKVRRKLKTIVPPEPYASDLPKQVLRQRGTIISSSTDESLVGDDESATSTLSFVSKGSISLQDDRKNKRSSCFTYLNFPSKFDNKLFGEPRPLPPAVLAEFDRQRENAAKFRRSKVMSKRFMELSNSPEVTTFTVFFMAYASLVGKDLVDLSNEEKSDKEVENRIFSTYNQRQNSIRAIALKATNLSSTFDQVADDVVPDSEKSVKQPRERFLDSLTILQVEEAKATAKAQLGLAFEMLEIMRDRELKADPVTYRCLIDACGRCGDTDRATELLARMHEDGIVADGIVYSCLVSAFSAENTWRKVSGTSTDHLPEWANGATVEVDWNKLEKPSWKGMRNKTYDGSRASEELTSTDSGRFRNAMMKLVTRRQTNFDDEEKKYTLNAPTWDSNSPSKDGFVTESVGIHIGFGENLLEIVYPDISIDTDGEHCPRCDTELYDDDVVMGWTSDPQDYTTKCGTCGQKFVPKFRVQSTSQLNGSRGPGTPLICERLSPWVLEKELRTKMSDLNGIEDILDPTWREEETKNQVLWWNLVLSFMRYRLPFTFLLQGNFPQKLIAPMPDESH